MHPDDTSLVQLIALSLLILAFAFLGLFWPRIDIWLHENREQRKAKEWRKKGGGK